MKPNPSQKGTAQQGNKPGWAQYIAFIQANGLKSTFVHKNPFTDWNLTHDEKFSWILDRGNGPEGWYWDEHLSYKGLHEGVLITWVTKVHASYGNIWFSNGTPGNADHDGDFPIFPDGFGKYWRIKGVGKGSNDLLDFLLEEYIPALKIK